MYLIVPLQKKDKERRALDAERMLSQADVEESFAKVKDMPVLRIVRGGKLKDPPRPLVRMAKVMGWILLALFALAVLSNCAPKPGGSCCLRGHEEPDTWLMPIDTGNDTMMFIPMEDTRFVCDLRGVRTDAGACQ